MFNKAFTSVDSNKHSGKWNYVYEALKNTPLLLCMRLECSYGIYLAEKMLIVMTRHPVDRWLLSCSHLHISIPQTLYVLASVFLCLCVLLGEEKTLLYLFFMCLLLWQRLGCSVSFYSNLVLRSSSQEHWCIELLFAVLLYGKLLCLVVFFNILDMLTVCSEKLVFHVLHSDRSTFNVYVMVEQFLFLPVSLLNDKVVQKEMKIQEFLCCSDVIKPVINFAGLDFFRCNKRGFVTLCEISLLWGMSVLQLIVLVLSINPEAKSFNFLFSNAFASHWVFKWFKMSYGFNCTVLISIFYVCKQHEHLFFVSIAFNFTYTKRDSIF